MEDLLYLIDLFLQLLVLDLEPEELFFDLHRDHGHQAEVVVIVVQLGSPEPRKKSETANGIQFPRKHESLTQLTIT